MCKDIKKYEVMNLLIHACPSYKKRWENYLKDNYEDNEGPLLYNDLSDFARHLADLYSKGNFEEFPKVFDVIERLHTDGDEEVQEAATIGLLEDLQNLGINPNPDGMKKYLHSVSLKWWNDLEDFWNGYTEYVGGPKK
ncbi:hypothetical protein BED47_18750 [Gottfriedia luciferensis]|uniref:DUF7674 domain-containing protein n=1 Tax=Gottfriedia luciferensis TaxID=178774 RepID=A0ABX2ZSH8_9BACI|nr:hypothetical protein [Gottfriedia luciferensis]ODG92716.1 hypothetical protein BED47_18750 [Gottfriedia luciferensis]